MFRVSSAFSQDSLELKSSKYIEHLNKFKVPRELWDLVAYGTHPGSDFVLKTVIV